jgi:uncharacterized membrane protein
MEKVGKQTLIGLIVLTIVGFFITLIGIGVYADNFGVVTKSEIERLSSEAKVLDDGSLFVSESWYYNTGRINGINVNLNYSEARGETVELESVYVQEQKSKRVPHASKGDSDVYTYKDTGNQQQLKIYARTSGKTKFTLNYRVQGLVKQYRDVQDVYWKIFTKGEQSIPLQIDATLSFPASVGKDTIKLFAHGDVAEGSTVALTEDNVVQVDVKGLYDNTFVEVRALLPDNPLPRVRNQSDEPKLDSILATEDKDVEQTKANILSNKGYKQVGKAVLLFVFISWVFVTLWAFVVFRRFYKKYDAEKYTSTLTYYRETPAYSPAVAALVLNPDKPMDQAQLIATIFSLYTKKALKLTELKKDVRIELLNVDEAAVQDSLSSDEQLVYDWLKKSFGKEQTGTYKEFFNISRQTRSSVQRFQDRMKNFEYSVHQSYRALELESYNGIDDKMPRSMYFILAFYLCLVAIMAIIQLFNDNYRALLFIIAALATVAAAIFGMLKQYKDNAYQLTEEGVRRRAQVRGLKNYLNDYSLLKDADTGAIHLWERYFVYGLALGVSKKALNRLYQNMPEAMSESVDFSTIYMMHHLSYHYNIVQRSHRAVVSMSQYASRGAGTSRSGGFGGFSGGGGGGSGGSSSGSF